MIKNLCRKISAGVTLLLLAIIKAYKFAISPLLGPRCRFYPSCSSYMYEAIQRHGVMKGFLLGLWRVLRCNPFSEGGFDPVPD